MITIKKNKNTFICENDSFIAFQDTHDGLYLKFKDNTELRFECAVTPQIKAIPQIVMKATAKNILIDFDNPKNMISLS